jgi:hypothetical protein
MVPNLIRWHYLWYVALALAVMLAVIASRQLWWLNFVHVFCGLLWTGIDLFMGFVLGPILRVIDVPAVYAQDNYLVYIRDRGLTAQRFDVGQARLVGPPTAVAGNAVTPTTTNGAVVSAADKLMAFGVSRATEQFEWFSRSGQRMGNIDTPTALRNPAVSPDSRQLLAASNTDPEHKGLWIIELERGGRTDPATSLKRRSPFDLSFDDLIVNRTPQKPWIQNIAFGGFVPGQSTSNQVMAFDLVGTPAHAPARRQVTEVVGQTRSLSL